MGFEPGAVGLSAHTNPLSYGRITNFSLHFCDEDDDDVKCKICHSRQKVWSDVGIKNIPKNNQLQFLLKICLLKKSVNMWATFERKFVAKN